MTYDQWSALHNLHGKTGAGPPSAVWDEVVRLGWMIGDELTPEGEAAYREHYDQYRLQRTPRNPIGRR